MRTGLAALALLVPTLSAPSASAAAGEPAERTFALIIGYNGRPALTSDDSIQPLHYADDDALAFYQFQKELGAEVVLLTIPDAETRRRYPQIVDEARQPTMNEIARAIDELNARMSAAARAGLTPVFVFFYSGHGARDANGDAALALLDGTLSQSAMHERVLGKIGSQTVHLIIDACHAEAVVRPRDIEARTVEIGPRDLVEHLSRTSAARYPNVGLVAASSSGASTHEWDLYQSGVFTHEVISGLRGVADVNHDGRVEYSELAAFLTAANREVVDPRARVASVVQPPAADGHRTLSHFGSRATIGWLRGIPPSAGRFFIEDVRGNRILDGHAEPGFSISVGVPPDQLLFLRNRDDEAELVVKAGAETRFSALAFHPRPLHPRGAMDTSLREGLFLMPYGPAYYSGYLDQLEVSDGARRAPAIGPSSNRRAAVWALRGGSVAFFATSTLFAGFAWDAHTDYDNTRLRRAADDAAAHYKLDTTLAISFAVAGAACAIASYFVGRRP